jgi:aspartyl-tRNA(Asn)/glutamyl-tRNA(Gln) amidotransferase subunit C
VAVTNDDVRHIAGLARLGVDEARLPALAQELNGILGHMEVLSQVDTAGVVEVVGVGVAGAPLRQDSGPQVPLARDLSAFAPELRDGLFIVPRLSTHADGIAVVLGDSVEAES